MKPRDAEKLLGGYAAGILTEKEKQGLFSAALEHQELFDALADEEAMRELLADPESRKQLLGILSESKAKGPVPFWRRPATLGLAASLLAMMTTSLVLWRREHPLLTVPETQEKREESKPASEVPSMKDTSKEKVLARRSVPEKVVPSAQAKGEMSDQAAAAPRALPVAELSLAAPSQAPKAEAAPEHLAERKKQLAERPPASAVVEVVANHAAADKTETTTAISRETLESLPTHRAVSGAATLSPGVAAGNVQPLGKASAKKDRANSVPAPNHVLERLENGVLRLTVTWATGNHLYILKRGASGITLLVPQSSLPERGGKTISLFEFSRGPQEQVDLYCLPQPMLDPKTLPAEGRIEGYRYRLP